MTVNDWLVVGGLAIILSAYVTGMPYAHYIVGSCLVGYGTYKKWQGKDDPL